MRRACWILPLLVVSAAPAQDLLADCEFGAEAMTKWREEAVTTSDLKLLASNLQTLGRGCPTSALLGDLYYLRGHVAKRLGAATDAKAFFNKATELKSALAGKGSDPFARAEHSDEPPPAKIGKKYALLIGVNTFEDKDIPPLRFAEADALALREYLQGPKGRFDPQRVNVLTGAKATLENVRAGISALRKAEPEDLVFIFLSSHGSPRSADPRGVSYVMMHNTKNTNEDIRYATALQMVDLVEDLKREIRARRLILVIDTCFSGDAVSREGSRRLVPAAAKPDAGWGAPVSGVLSALQSGAGRAIISASRGDQESWESPVYKNGYFTHFFIEALSANEGNTQLRTAFEAARAKTQAAVKADKHADQEPQWQGSESAGGMVLGEAESSGPRAMRLPVLRSPAVE